MFITLCFSIHAFGLMKPSGCFLTVASGCVMAVIKLRTEISVSPAEFHNFIGPRAIALINCFPAVDLKGNRMSCSDVWSIMAT